MVVTGGGIIGKVIKVPAEGDELTVEIAENVRVKVLRATIGQVLSRTEPAKGDEADKPEKAEKA
jgi:preprotein translocase subunit YajC